MIKPIQNTVGKADLHHPTLWGLSPVQLHDRYWAARGVQVVRAGEQSMIVEDAELFLLTAPRLLCLFRLRDLIDPLSWLKPDVMWIRLSDGRERGYHEEVVADEQGNFLRHERHYGGSDTRLARVALTPNREIAHLWQQCSDRRTAWKALRDHIPRKSRAVHTCRGLTADRDRDEEVAQFVRDMIKVWKRPDAVIDGVKHVGDRVYRDTSVEWEDSPRFVGGAWVGAGRTLKAEDTIVGPAVLWDAPEARPQAGEVVWEELEPSAPLPTHVKRAEEPSIYRFSKRLFDIAFASAALLGVLPVFPLVMLAIYLEDGGPFFFAHQRETLGGKQFPCLKFRSMRKDAEEIKKRIMANNQVDGPQFFIEDDPRVTRVGKFIRKTHIDEFPQFFNVLAGHMSIVGPRPSPFKENQYCPPWREARLSVRPGITGLWQVMRTRKEGLDFQEWIRFDMQYVETRNFRLDLWIIYQTVVNIIKRK